MENETFNSWANKINNTSYNNSQYKYKLKIKKNHIWETEPIIFIEVYIDNNLENLDVVGIDVLLYAINNIITEYPNIKNTESEFMISKIILNAYQSDNVDLLKILNLDVEFKPQSFSSLTKTILKHKNQSINLTTINKTINNRINKLNNTLEYLAQTYETNIIKINKITFNVYPKPIITTDPALILLININYQNPNTINLSDEIKINKNFKQELIMISPVDIHNYDTIKINYIKN